MPEELQPIDEFLAERGIESLADQPVTGHDGVQVTLAEALASCAPARTSIDSTIETIRDLVGQDADILPAMTNHIGRMSKKAQSTIPTPETQAAEKK